MLIGCLPIYPMFVRTQWDTQALFSPSSVPALCPPCEAPSIPNFLHNIVFFAIGMGSEPMITESDSRNRTDGLIERRSAKLLEFVAPTYNKISAAKSALLSSKDSFPSFQHVVKQNRTVSHLIVFAILQIALDACLPS